MRGPSVTGNCHVAPTSTTYCCSASPSRATVAASVSPDTVVPSVGVEYDAPASIDSDRVIATSSRPAAPTASSMDESVLNQVNGGGSAPDALVRSVAAASPMPYPPDHTTPPLIVTRGNSGVVCA